MKTRVLIVDDHNMLRQSLAKALSTIPDIVVVGEAANGAEAQHRALSLRPDVILMDLNMPGVDGITATKWLSESAPNTRILVLTMFGDEQHLFEALKAGAHGYILKSADLDDLASAIQGVMRGQFPIDPSLSVSLLSEFRRLAGQGVDSEKGVKLGHKEVAILRLVAQGLSNKEIGGRMCMAERTVKNYLTNIFKKIGISDRVQAALYAHRNNLLADEPIHLGRETDVAAEPAMPTAKRPVRTAAADARQIEASVTSLSLHRRRAAGRGKGAN